MSREYVQWRVTATRGRIAEWKTTEFFSNKKDALQFCDQVLSPQTYSYSVEQVVTIGDPDRDFRVVRYDPPVIVAERPARPTEMN